MRWQPIPVTLSQEDAAEHLKPCGNVTVLRNRQDDDPLMGRCGRCGRWWSQHPGGYCPDGIDRGGLVSVNGPIFVPPDEVGE